MKKVYTDSEPKYQSLIKFYMWKSMDHLIIHWYKICVKVSQDIVHGQYCQWFRMTKQSQCSDLN